MADGFVQAYGGVVAEVEGIDREALVEGDNCFGEDSRLKYLTSFFLSRGAELESLDGAHCISEVWVDADRVLQHLLAGGLRTGVAEDATTPALDQRYVHHIRVVHQLFGEVDSLFELVRTKQVLTLQGVVFDADWAAGQNVGAVDHCTLEVIITLVSSELLKHLDLVDDCVDHVLILHIGRIVCIELDGAVEGLLCLHDLAQGQVRRKEPLVDSRKCGIKSYPCLAVLDGLPVHFEVDVAHGAVGENLDGGLDVARLCVESDRRAVVFIAECLVPLHLFRFCLCVWSCLYHFWLLICF